MNITLVQSPDLVSWSDSAGATAGSIGLFVACDASDMSTDMLGQAARTFLLNGAAWISVWGPDCERVHDIIDEEHVALCVDDPERTDVVTTWHADESLDEALQFFVDAAHWPKHSAFEWLAVVVARADWYDRIRTLLNSR